MLYLFVYMEDIFCVGGLVTEATNRFHTRLTRFACVAPKFFANFISSLKNHRKYQKILRKPRKSQRVQENRRESQKFLKYLDNLENPRKSKRIIRNPKKFQKILQKRLTPLVRVLLDKACIVYNLRILRRLDSLQLHKRHNLRKVRTLCIGRTLHHLDCQTQGFKYTHFP